MAKTLIERFREKFIVHPVSRCWIWTGAKIPNGYGSIGGAFGKKSDLAHRVSYRLHVGEIPVGLNIDHLCRVRHCVNPDHLEPVTHAENVRRGLSPGILVKAANEIQWAKTHCPSGHQFSEENTYLWNSPTGIHRACRICRKVAYDKGNAKASAKRKAALC